MAYLGRQPIIGNYQVLDALTASATATYALTKNSVAVFPQTPANCIVSLNGVIQAPFDSYTISGSNIVFASALTGSDSIDFITVLGDVLNIGVPSDGTVTTAKLADSSVSLAKLTATGTKDATTFLRGDNTFAAVSTGAYSIAQFSETTITSATNSTNNSAVRLGGTNEITVTPSASTDLIEVRAHLSLEAQLTDYNGIGIQISTVSGSYSTATTASLYLVSTGEWAQGSGIGADSERYQFISLTSMKTASDWGLSAGTTYYLSLHGINHGNGGRTTTFGNAIVGSQNSKHFSLTRYTV
jgi:hypothetical protein